MKYIFGKVVHESCCIRNKSSTSKHQNATCCELNAECFMCYAYSYSLPIVRSLRRVKRQWLRLCRLIPTHGHQLARCSAICTLLLHRPGLKANGGQHVAHRETGVRRWRATTATTTTLISIRRKRAFPRRLPCTSMKPVRCKAPLVERLVPALW